MKCLESHTDLPGCCLHIQAWEVEESLASTELHPLQQPVSGILMWISFGTARLLWEAEGDHSQAMLMLPVAILGSTVLFVSLTLEKDQFALRVVSGLAWVITMTIPNSGLEFCLRTNIPQNLHPIMYGKRNLIVHTHPSTASAWAKCNLKRAKHQNVQQIQMQTFSPFWV